MLFGTFWHDTVDIQYIGITHCIMSFIPDNNRLHVGQVC